MKKLSILVILVVLVRLDLLAQNHAWDLRECCTYAVEHNISIKQRVNTRERRTIVIEIGMQNAAQAIAIASSPLVFNNDTIAIPAIIYALMMNIILIAYVAIVKNRE